MDMDIIFKIKDNLSCLLNVDMVKLKTIVYILIKKTFKFKIDGRVYIDIDDYNEN